VLQQLLPVLCCRALFAIDAVFGAFFFVNLLLQLHIPVRVSASFYQLLLHNGWGVFKVYRRQVRGVVLLLLLLLTVSHCHGGTVVAMLSCGFWLLGRVHQPVQHVAAGRCVVLLVLVALLLLQPGNMLLVKRASCSRLAVAAGIPGSLLAACCCHCLLPGSAAGHVLD
jgi:hypothetical protein